MLIGAGGPQLQVTRGEDLGTHDRLRTVIPLEVNEDLQTVSLVSLTLAL